MWEGLKLDISPRTPYMPTQNDTEIAVFITLGARNFCFEQVMALKFFGMMANMLFYHWLYF